MAFLVWNDQLSVGIPSMDVQHKVLIGYINNLSEAIDAGNSASVLLGIISSLAQYAQVYFMYEEMFFEETDYAAASDHKQNHGKILAAVAAFKDRPMNDADKVARELLEFLNGWLVNHILKEDMAYSAHLVVWSFTRRRGD